MPRREVLAERILERAVSWAVALWTPHHHYINIYQASRSDADGVSRLIRRRFLLIDPCRWTSPPQRPADQGRHALPRHRRSSIIAKGASRRLHARLDQIFPGYGLASHKGYRRPSIIGHWKSTAPTPLHRNVSFEPVRAQSSSRRV